MTEAHSNARLLEIIDEAQTIAMVGASNNPVRPSFFVATYFNSRGRRIIPVNPMLVGEGLFGEPFLASISDIPKGTAVDMVDIFRRSDEVPAIVDEALEHLIPGLRTIWMQYGVSHADAAQRARASSLNVVENRCPKVDHMRLAGALNSAGVKTGVVSSRLPRTP
ncbi:MAG: CoA-binding protein [Pseudomonadota bacterium]